MVGGYADTQPRAPNDTPANRALNRRIDITLLTNKPRHSMWEASEETLDQEVDPAGDDDPRDPTSPETASPEIQVPQPDPAPAL
jgi:hypothetical protein